ncbi:MAG: hypothetical protein E7641_03355 [Ruminococcaceae bacterium]|nr:hypothetical protein [Oscillospiraceae bacterium]
MTLVLVLSTLLVCFSACGTDGEDPSNTTVITTADEGGETGDGATTTEDRSVSKLPDKDWGGDSYSVLGRDGGVHVQFYNHEIAADTLNGEVVNDAVYTRNEMIKTKYNIIVQKTLRSDVYATADLLYKSGDDLYDLVIYVPKYAQMHAEQGFLSDLTTVPHVNLNHIAWNDYANEQLTVMGRLYYTTSDFLIQDKSRTYIILYNRGLLRSFEEYSDLYIEDWVESGEWTLEKAAQLVSDFSYEVDGIDGHNENDAFGLTLEGPNSFATLLIGAGFRFSTVEDGVPKFVGVDEKIISIIDKTLAFAGDRTMAMYDGEWPASPTLTWCDGRSLLFCSFPSVFESSLNKYCNFEFGILPFPKYDTAQEKYYTHINIGYGSFFAIPMIAENQEFCGFGLEVLTEFSTDTTLEAFYETKCKLQDVYDQRCADMLDLVFENVVYDIAAICNYGGLYDHIATTVITMNMNVYQRLYNKTIDQAQIELDEMLASYSA